MADTHILMNVSAADLNVEKAGRCTTKGSGKLMIKVKSPQITLTSISFLEYDILKLYFKEFKVDGEVLRGAHSSEPVENDNRLHWVGVGTLDLQLTEEGDGVTATATAINDDVEIAENDPSSILLYRVKYKRVPIAPANPFPSIATFLREMLDDTTHSDVIFSVCGQQFHAHKLVLLRVPYFRVMFSGSFREKTTKVQAPIELKFDGVDAPAFSQFLTYAYTEDTDLAMKDVTTAEHAQSLLRLAHAIEVPALTFECEQLLIGPLFDAVGDPIDSLVLAHSRGCNRLKRKLLEYLVDSLPRVGRTKCFLELGHQHPDLFGEVMDVVHQSCKRQRTE